MTRLFGRGQLKAAVLAAVALSEPANGYAVMAALADTVGGDWRPSPGAIYPALLGLEDAGLIVGVDDTTGSRIYRLTDAGRAHQPDGHRALADAAHRARTAEPAPTLGPLLDTFLRRLPARSVRLTADQHDHVADALDRAHREVIRIITKEQPQ